MGKHKKNGPDASGAQEATPKLTARQRRQAKKKARQEKLPLHKRPVICPPDPKTRHLAFRLGGYLCRAIIIWAATAGLTIFVSSAMEYGISNRYIAGISLIAVALCALFCYGKPHRFLAGALAGGLAAFRLVTMPRPQDVFYGVLALYNGCLDRLYKVGYLSYVRYKAPIGTPTPNAELLRLGVGLMAILFAVAFTLCLIRRVRLIFPAVMSTTFLVVILTFNIYSNRIQTNLGIAMVIVSFASILVMSAYDRMYRIRDDKKGATDLTLFRDTDRPAWPEAYRKAEEEKKARKQARQSRVRRTEPMSVEEELNDYFAPKSTQKGATGVPEGAAEKAARKAEHKAMMKQVRAVRRYDRITESAQSAVGGFMALAALMVCMVAVALPAVYIKGNFSTIHTIDEKMAFARDYVTAVLRGDDQTLDELEYQADNDNFKNHATDLKQLSFTGKQIFFVETRYNTNYYLTGWVGTDYVNGGWTAVDDDTLNDYRALFDTDCNPNEEMRYQFYHYMKPSPVDQEEYNRNLLTKYKSNLDYGFVNVLFHIRRVNSPSSVCYFPASFGSSFGIYDYGTMDESLLTYVNYFDGIRTGRKFKSNGISYATMAYAPVMTNDTWAANVSALAASYTLQKEALLIRSMVPQDLSDGSAASSRLNLSVLDNGDGTTLFTFTPHDSKDQRAWRFYHDTSTVRRSSQGEYSITTSAGVLFIRVSGNRVLGVRLSGCPLENSSNLLYQYENTMTSDQQADLLDALELDWNYSDFAYRTYTQKSDSEIIRALATTILEQAHRQVENIQQVVIPDDPETEEDDSFTYDEITLENQPVKLPLAALRNATAAQAMVQRDLLVRNVIDYIIDEMGCRYTISPDLSAVDPTLDGVENFLVNTHEGYCVQFASAVVLILREYGIPARYVEGYLATNLTRKSGSDFVYSGYVHDYEAHAWVEVFFDGIGWIQYETTPQYYTGMYGAKGTGSTLPTPPPIMDETQTPDTSPDAPADTLPDEDGTLSQDSETLPALETDDGFDPEVVRSAGITLLILIGGAAIVLILAAIVRKAREAEAHRQSLVSQILEEHFGEHTGEADRREMSLALTDAVNTLLSLYGLAPKPGEFREAYAERLTAEFAAEAEDHSDREEARRDADDVRLPDLRLVLEAMAAEEFGHGMTISEMKQVALLYIFLRRDLKTYIPWGERLRLRYIKHLI